jgi:DNA-binding FadR family transcriptional regulator
VAALMRDDIERAGWSVGSLLGSEPELVEQYGVSRAVLREAIRLLEYHGSVTTRRGPGGGVFVAQPVSGAAIHAARVVLEYEGVESADIWAARRIVEELCVRLATARAGDAGAQVLHAALEEETAARAAAVREHVVHRALAVVSENRLLVLFVDVLAELGAGRVLGAIRAKRTGLPNLAEAHRAHELIVEAVLAGDEERAVRRMARHLQAVSRSV